MIIAVGRRKARQHVITDNITTISGFIQWQSDAVTVTLLSSLVSINLNITMAASTFKNTKKRKVTEEGRVFKQEWTLKYFFVEDKDNPVCVICKLCVCVMKVSNIARHYDTMHKTEYDELRGEARKKILDRLTKELKQQQTLFFKSSSSKDKTLLASYIVSQKIAEKRKPFSDGEFVKECMHVGLCRGTLP